MFQNYYSQLQLPNNVDMDNFKTCSNFITNNNYFMHNSKIYHQILRITQGGYSFNMMVDLFLNYYEKNF